MIKSIVAATILATVMGCAHGGTTDDTLNGTAYYTVIIDPTFNAEDTTAILDGLATWTTLANGSLAFESSVGACGGDSHATNYASAGTNVSNTSHTICFHVSSQAAIIAMGGESGYIGVTFCTGDHSSDIYIPVAKDVGFTALQMKQIVMHETGHSLSLHHVTIATSALMYPSIDEASTVPTCNDWQQYVDNQGEAFSFITNPMCPNGGTYVLSGN